MTFVADETSFANLEAGFRSRPAELYRFDFGTDTYRFTSAEGNITFQSATWTAIPIKRSTPTLNPRERRSTKLQIEAPASRLPFSQFVGIQPALRLECQILRIQLDERAVGNQSPAWPSPVPPAAPFTTFLLFEGYVSSIAFKNQIAMMELNPFNEQFTREIPRLKYQGLCNHILYDNNCTVDPTSFQQSGLVAGQVGNTYTINGFSGNAFTGGYIRNFAEDDFRTVLSQSGDQFTVLLPFSQSIVGSNVTVFQGCDHSVQTCRDKFSNVVNYGGFPLIPSVNPFNQSQFTKS